MKYEGLKVNKESVDKLFPKQDINVLGYESPIKTVTDQPTTEISKRADENIWEAVIRTGVVVDKDELIKALQYDRDQYEKGYRNGYERGCGADKWISVEDKLPDIYESCIIMVATKYAWENEWRRDTDVGCLNDDGEWDTWNDWDEGNEVVITHWKPLHELPNESEGPE